MKSTFKRVADAWKEEKRRYVKISSYAAYMQLLNCHILPFMASRDVPDDDTLQLLADKMLYEGIGIKTVKDTLLVFKMIIHYGSKTKAWGPVDTRVHYPTQREVQKMPPVMDKNYQHKLLDYLRTHISFRNLGIFLCLHSGLRIGEVCGLRWKDLDIQENVIHVNKTVQRIFLRDGVEQLYFLSIDSPKSASSRRDIPISAELLKIIRPLRKITVDNYFVLSNAPMPIEPRNYREYYKRLLRELDIPQVRFHALRHSFATRCIESKCDYKTVSAILGHASITTTMDLYVHPGFEEKKRCIEKMSRGM